MCVQETRRRKAEGGKNRWTQIIQLCRFVRQILRVEARTGILRNRQSFAAQTARKKRKKKTRQNRRKKNQGFKVGKRRGENRSVEEVLSCEFNARLSSGLLAKPSSTSTLQFMKWHTGALKSNIAPLLSAVTRRRRIKNKSWILCSRGSAEQTSFSPTCLCVSPQESQHEPLHTRD